MLNKWALSLLLCASGSGLLCASITASGNVSPSITGGTTSVNTSNVLVGDTRAGALTVSDGALTASNILSLGNNSAGVGTMTISGGAVRAGNVHVGHYGSGSMLISGGAMTPSMHFNIGNMTGSRG